MGTDRRKMGKDQMKMGTSPDTLLAACCLTCSGLLPTLSLGPHCAVAHHNPTAQPHPQHITPSAPPSPPLYLVRASSPPVPFTPSSPLACSPAAPTWPRPRLISYPCHVSPAHTHPPIPHLRPRPSLASRPCHLRVKGRTDGSREIGPID